MKVSKLCIFLLIISYSCNTKAQLKSTNLPSEHNILELLKKYKVPAVGIGIIENGKIKKIKVYGEARKNTPVCKNTLFSIASQTKPVIAMMTLRLVEAGLWDLDEPLYKYWIDPDISNDSLHKQLTTRHILSHSSGFANWRRNEPKGELTFHFRPGTQFQYSGEGMEYLKSALENKFEMSLDQLLSKYLLNPLKMTSTQYWNNKIDLNNFAAWNDSNGKPYMVSYDFGIGAAGGLITTVEDYCKLLIYVMEMKTNSPIMYNELSKPITKIKTDNYYGIGWAIATNLSNNEYALHHGGSDIGVRTNAIFLPVSERGVVVMTNGDNGMFVYNKIIKESLDIGEDILVTINNSIEKRKEVKVAKKDIEKYIGIYEQQDGRLFIIEVIENGIKVSGKGSPTAILVPESKHTFFMPDYDIKLVFSEQEKETGYKMIIYENGNRVVLAKSLKNNNN